MDEGEDLAGRPVRAATRTAMTRRPPVRRTTTRPAPAIPSAIGPGISASMAADIEVSPAVHASPAAVPEKPASRDIGTWTFTPWKSNDMWTHRATGRTSFNEAEVRKLRRL